LSVSVFFLFLFTVNDSLFEPTTTGLAYRSSTSTFFVLDWKTKLISEFLLLNSDTFAMELQHQFTSSSFNEPVQIALFHHHPNSVLICDSNSLLIIDKSTGDLINQIDTRSVGIKTIKTFTIGQQDEILIGDHRIHMFSYEGKYLRQICSLTLQQIVDVDVHVTHQPPDLIPSDYKQPIYMSQQSKSSQHSITKATGGGKENHVSIDLIQFSFERLLYGTSCRSKWISIGRQM